MKTIKKEVITFKDSSEIAYEIILRKTDYHNFNFEVVINKTASSFFFNASHAIEEFNHVVEELKELSK